MEKRNAKSVVSWYLQIWDVRFNSQQPWIRQ